MTLAFVFPGQGSQSVGMLQALSADNPVVQQTFAAASSVLGYDLWSLCQQGPEADLNATERTQPAMLTASVATWRTWLAHGGPRPAVMAGHSLGEFSALVCADAIDFSTAVALVQFRAQAMQEAVPAGQGAMAAILGIDDAEAEAACLEAAAGDVVEPVNYNAPGQIVIAGSAAAVARAVEACKARGAKRAILLPVSVPSHSSLMRGAGERLRERLASVEIRVPSIEVYAVGLRRHSDPAAIRTNLVEQLYSPVRWSDTVRDLVARRAGPLIECGPGKVLTALNRRIERNKDIGMLAIEDPASLTSALAAAQPDRQGSN